MINLMVNGKAREVEEGSTLEAYLLTFDVNLKFIAVGYNGQVVKKDSYAGTTLRHGDALEIVRTVGGG